MQVLSVTTVRAENGFVIQVTYDGDRDDQVFIATSELEVLSTTATVLGCTSHISVATN